MGPGGSPLRRVVPVWSVESQGFGGPWCGGIAGWGKASIPTAWLSYPRTTPPDFYALRLGLKREPSEASMNQGAMGFVRNEHINKGGVVVWGRVRWSMTHAPSRITGQTARLPSGHRTASGRVAIFVIPHVTAGVHRHVAAACSTPSHCARSGAYEPGGLCEERTYIGRGRLVG